MFLMMGTCLKKQNCKGISSEKNYAKTNMFYAKQLIFEGILEKVRCLASSSTTIYAAHERNYVILIVCQGEGRGIQKSSYGQLSY